MQAASVSIVNVDQAVNVIKLRTRAAAPSHNKANETTYGSSGCSLTVIFHILEMA